MTGRPDLVVGLMSGTSLDGMDAALVRLKSATEAELVGFVHRRYTAEQREELLRALEGEATPRDYARLHVRLAEWAGEAVERLLGCWGIPVVASRLVDSAHAAGLAATELGGPVALKAVAPGLVHKSDAGAVQLGLADAVDAGHG